MPAGAPAAVSSDAFFHDHCDAAAGLSRTVLALAGTVPAR